MNKRSFFEWLVEIPEPRKAYLAKPSFTDRILEKTFLIFIPNAVTPNQITKLRLLSIPVIIYFFLVNDFFIGTILFALSAFSDAIDGAMARTRNQISGWGMLYDPLADKLLIGTVAAIVISKYLSPYLALTIVVLEVFLVLSAYMRYKGKVVPAKTMGKMKMVLQCFGIIFLLLHLALGPVWLLTLAWYTLYLAVVFALLSLFVFRSI